ncbi:hypothetical protein JWG44_19185 [Leptospira sp. 201903071]|uniref:hypothetical protein n=1 Tax=Leptospira ainazelensis TaxID=2810034 RepID=UPI001965FF66|nr:hypothetical protein [Leptospira ainazelensis]MBM9502380.1 hypothetical protein [Leptospira ainazelensis]
MALADILHNYNKFEFPKVAAYFEIPIVEENRSPTILFEYVSNSIFEILTETAQNENQVEGILNHLAKVKKDLFLTLINSENERSDVRGYAAKLLIINSRISDLDLLASEILRNFDSLIRFGVLYGLEEIEDYDRIRQLFLTDYNKRIKETAIDILERSSDIYSVFQQVPQSV